jgi:hypothetical protein
MGPAGLKPKSAGNVLLNVEHRKEQQGKKREKKKGVCHPTVKVNIPQITLRLAFSQKTRAISGATAPKPNNQTTEHPPWISPSLQPNPDPNHPISKKSNPVSSNREMDG